MGILDIFGKRNSGSGNAGGVPFMVSTELTPYKMRAKTSSQATLTVKVKNVTKEVLLASVVAESPQNLGFDQMIMNKQKEEKLGEMQPGEQKELRIGIYSSVASDPGEYTMSLTAYSHYRDYTHILNSVKKKIPVELV